MNLFRKVQILIFMSLKALQTSLAIKQVISRFCYLCRCTHLKYMPVPPMPTLPMQRT
jgi:hypothetical protein